MAIEMKDRNLPSPSKSNNSKGDFATVKFQVYLTLIFSGCSRSKKSAIETHTCSRVSA